jgi:hypothetical protein
MSHKMQGVHVPDWNEIKSYFTPTDIQHMLAATGLDLSDCSTVLANAAAIFQQVSTGKMPPGNPWGPDKINGFFAWWKSNPTCPASATATASDCGGSHTAVLRASGASPVAATTASTSNWIAWNDVSPPGPASFHIIGEIQVGNPGIDVLLTEMQPQGINPEIILLDLHLIQRPGLWPQHVVTKLAQYEKPGSRYLEASVLYGSTTVATVPVINIS